MARIPERPELGRKQNLLFWLIERVVKMLIGTWVMFQVIGIIFWAIWHISSHDFREFMFRGYINYWDKWGYYIMTELTPSWLQWIWYLPTWKSPITWIILVGGLIVWWFWQAIKSRISFPSIRDYFPRSQSPAQAKPHKKEKPPKDDSFEFDSARWKKEKPEE